MIPKSTADADHVAAWDETKRVFQIPVACFAGRQIQKLRRRKVDFRNDLFQLVFIARIKIDKSAVDQRLGKYQKMSCATVFTFRESFAL